MVEEQKQQTELRWQTFSNRDYLNKIYVDKYEACIESLMNAILENPNMRDERKFPKDLREKLFKKGLASLYWSFVVPRIPLFDKDDEELDEPRKKYKPFFMEKSKEKKIDFESLSIEDSSNLLTSIGEYLYMMGVTRTEKKEKDLDHVGMEERDVNT